MNAKILPRPENMSDSLSCCQGCSPKPDASPFNTSSLEWACTETARPIFSSHDLSVPTPQLSGKDEVPTFSCHASSTQGASDDEAPTFHDDIEDAYWTAVDGAIDEVKADECEAFYAD